MVKTEHVCPLKEEITGKKRSVDLIEKRGLSFYSIKVQRINNIIFSLGNSKNQKDITIISNTLSKKIKKERIKYI